MNQKLENLLDQLGIVKREIFLGFDLKKVVVDTTLLSWHFEFTSSKVLPFSDFIEFSVSLREKFQHMAKISYSIKSDQNGYEKSLLYLKHVVDLIIHEKRSLSFLVNANITYRDGLYIEVGKGLLGSVKSNLNIIYDKLKKIGINDAINVVDTLDINYEEKLNERLNKQIKISKEERQKLEESKIKEPVNKYSKKDNTSIRFNSKFVGIPIEIKDIPTTQIAMDQYLSVNHKAKFVISGEVFSLDSRDLKNNSTLYQIGIYDGTSSLVVKKFINDDSKKTEFLNIFQIGKFVEIKGEAKWDTYSRDVSMMIDGVKEIEPIFDRDSRMDNSKEKRVELHTHSKMSTQDSILSVKEYVKLASKFGHKALAITDHNGLYAFPEFEKECKKNKIKPIYGVEVNGLIEEELNIAYTNDSVELHSATYVVFDIETTGFSVNFDEIIEIAALKIENGSIVDRYETYVKPNQKITQTITNITSIKNEDVRDAPSIEQVMNEFNDFTKGSILVAHNASFDVDHIYENYKRLNIMSKYNVIDTLQLFRFKYGLNNEKIKRFNLKAMCKYFGVTLTQHHRAIYDTTATADVFLKMLSDLRKDGITDYNQINEKYLSKDIHRFSFPKHFNILVKTQNGLKNLFKLVSISHTETFDKSPIVLRGTINKYRDGLIIGSGCPNSILFKKALEKSYEDLYEEMKFYDFIELQPIWSYSFMLNDYDKEVKNDRILKTLERIVECAKKQNKLIVATGDVHYIDKMDKQYRDIYTKTPVTGGGMHPFNRVNNTPYQHFLTTDEMLQGFPYLKDEEKNEIVITNTNIIADLIDDDIKVVKDELYTPKDDFLLNKGIPSIKEKLTDMVNERATNLYGDILPEIVKLRLDKELKSIIENGFAVIYYISHMLVKKSIDEGYLVGSRGSVGSSLVATFMDITEVNPLSPHYRCGECRFSTFKMNDEEKTKYVIKENEKELQLKLDKADSGFDLEDAVCPNCGNKLSKDGHDIPFETFLGYEGDKVPDIDLNFSGDYQPIAHNYCKEVFGEYNAFKAGTISTVASKTAFGYVKSYCEKIEKNVSNAEAARIASQIEGAKRTTGQHPGGIIIVPDYVDIYDFTPIQYPSDDQKSEWMTTHFDFHSIHDNLLKLDILGHDDPTIIKHLMDYVKANPSEFSFSNARDIPVDDKNVYKLFSGTDVLGVTSQEIRTKIGSYGVPEFGTPFVRGMLEDTHPKTFAELVKISGLSHGTDVWMNNAKELVTGKHDKFAQVEFKSVIGCRDDIMVYLIYQGLEPQDAFQIMEFVRKGKPSKEPQKWQEYSDLMNEKGVPAWYIWSCKQIKYMFPKAHATAYVLMAIRIAWFKVNKPLVYYSAYFSKRATQFDVFSMLDGKSAVMKKIIEIEAKGYAASATEKSLQNVLEIALEFLARGFGFEKIDILKSDVSNFDIIDDNKLRLPFISLSALGINVAKTVLIAREEKEFTSIEDVKKRTKLNKSQMENLLKMGTFEGMNEKEQYTQKNNLFELEM